MPIDLSALTEITKIYTAVNQMVSLNVAGVVREFVDEDLQAELFQHSQSTNEDLEDTIAKRVADAVQVAREIVKQNTGPDGRAIFLPSSKRNADLSFRSQSRLPCVLGCTVSFPGRTCSASISLGFGVSSRLA